VNQRPRVLSELLAYAEEFTRDSEIVLEISVS